MLHVLYVIYLVFVDLTIYNNNNTALYGGIIVLLLNIGLEFSHHVEKKGEAYILQPLIIHQNLFFTPLEWQTSPICTQKVKIAEKEMTFKN